VIGAQIKRRSCEISEMGTCCLYIDAFSTAGIDDITAGLGQVFDGTKVSFGTADDRLNTPRWIASTRILSFHRSWTPSLL